MTMSGETTSNSPIDPTTAASAERHRRSPEVAPGAYFKHLRTELGHKASTKIRIYLDTCYWLRLRDAATGRGTTAGNHEVLERLRHLVSNGRVICPVSDAAFLEIMKQSDGRTRSATASLMDELSQGVALITEETRVRLELVDLILSPASASVDFHLSMWVAPGFIFGESLPHSDAFADSDIRLIQKVWIDTLWATSVSTLAADESDYTLQSAMNQSAGQINLKNTKHAGEIKSYMRAWEAEVSGVVKFCDERVVREISTIKGLELSNAEVARAVVTTQTFLFNAFRLRPDFMAQRAPSLYTHAACHAAIRFDKGRKLDGNWLLDLHHACAASGYFNAMFTEGPLKVLMTNGNVAIDKRRGLSIFSKPEDALAYLDQLLASDQRQRSGGA